MSGKALFEYPIRLAVLLCELVGKLYFRIGYRPRLTFTGKEVVSFRFREPSIIIANHTSTNDPILLLSLITHKRSIVVAKDWFEKKQFHWILSREKCIPCDRYNLDTEWALLAKKQLEAGNSVIIFPEGKCREDGLLNEFKSGFAFLARSTGVPVIPVGIDGVYRFGHRTQIVVGEAERIPRVKGIPSSAHLAERSEYFRQKVWRLKLFAKKAQAAELPPPESTPPEEVKT